MNETEIVYVHTTFPISRPVSFHLERADSGYTRCGVKMSPRVHWACLMPLRHARKLGVGCRRCGVE
jgi:hypothetical protein